MPIDYFAGVGQDYPTPNFYGWKLLRFDEPLRHRDRAVCVSTHIQFNLDTRRTPETGDEIGAGQAGRAPNSYWALETLRHWRFYRRVGYPQARRLPMNPIYSNPLPLP